MNESVVTVRVRYPEVDRMQVAHHMHYLAWFEIGRTEVMRAAGVPYGALEDIEKLAFPVIEVGARYRSPARYDEEIEIRTTLAETAGARVRFTYRIVRPGAGTLLAEGFTVHAALGAAGRPVRIPPAVCAALAAWSAS